MELVTEKYVREMSGYEEPAPMPVDRPEAPPSVYVHEHCGQATQMPASVRRNYLADPCFYFLGTICAHCGGGVEESKCYWVETGERLDVYMKRLAKGKSRAYHIFRRLPLILGVLVGILASILVARQGGPANPIGFTFCVVVVWGVTTLPIRFLRLFLCRLGVL